jgi:D-xylulose reductase
VLTVLIYKLHLTRKKNLSFVLEKVQTLKFENRPTPQLQDPHDVLVRVKFTGICGSDVSDCPKVSIQPRNI